MACRFPGADDPDAFFDLLRRAGVMAWQAPPDRQPLGWGPEDPPAGFIDGIDRFDAAFFSISAREANEMDPQQRLVLTVAWEALERAGIAPASLAGSRTAVWMGPAAPITPCCAPLPAAG